jgi:hypothetical protein
MCDLLLLGKLIECWPHIVCFNCTNLLSCHYDIHLGFVGVLWMVFFNCPAGAEMELESWTVVQ